MLRILERLLHTASSQQSHARDRAIIGPLADNKGADQWSPDDATVHMISISLLGLINNNNYKKQLSVE